MLLGFQVFIRNFFESASNIGNLKSVHLSFIIIGQNIITNLGKASIPVSFMKGKPMLSRNQHLYKSLIG